jgi:small-conductance mechanosensitive channel
MAAAVGLAAQDALSNFIGGLFIVISKPFRVGDYIQVEGTVTGTVKEITLRHTVIVNNENRTILVPNGVINSKTIMNSTVLDSRTCAFIEINVSYNENLDRAMEVMREEVMRHPMLIDHRSEKDIEEGVPLVKTKVISLDDSSVKLRAWAWAATSANAFNMKCDLLKNIKERFDREGIEIPYPYFNQVLVK